MLHFRRPVAATLLASAAILPALAGTPAYAVSSSSAAVQEAAPQWVLVGTYADQPTCHAAGPDMAAGHQWQCTPSPSVASAYDLYVWEVMPPTTAATPAA
jgi:hypothetical protein